MNEELDHNCRLWSGYLILFVRGSGPIQSGMADPAN